MSEKSLNERGNEVQRRFFLDRDRYFYDLSQCPGYEGWEQYDTENDFSHFGVWINESLRKIITFVEGDEITVVCPSAAQFRWEIAALNECYGKAAD